MASFQNFTSPSQGNSSPSMPPMPPVQATSSVGDILIDYNERFAGADPVMFRDDVIREMEAVLIGRLKPNVLLVGDPGTGKTAVVEDLARRIAQHDPAMPASLASSRVMELPLASLVAGTSLAGSLEERVTDVIDFASDPANDVVLFIDEAHRLVGRDPQMSVVSQALKPALARGDVRVIAATTMQEARRLSDDPAFSRRFTRLVVTELTPAQTVDVMTAQMPSVLDHYDHKVSVPDAVLPVVVAVADETLQTHRPDSALTLLDRTCAEARMCRADQEASTDPVVMRYVRAVPSYDVTEPLVREVASRMVRGTASDLPGDRDVLEAALADVQGQDAQVAEVTDALVRRGRNLFPKTRPLSFLLAGPSGVGKSMCARIVASTLTGEPPIVLNMTEYSGHSSLTRLLGSSPGYVGSDSMREKPLDPLMTNPYRVVILDELEKASPDVQRVFMEALDTGVIHDAYGRDIDFSKAIVFATTNAGCDRAAVHALGFTSSTRPSRADLVDVLSQWFDVALVNRFTHLVRFSPIPRETYAGIVAALYAREAARITSEHSSVHLPDELPPDELSAVVDATYVPAFGARPARSAVEDWVERHA